MNSLLVSQQIEDILAYTSVVILSREDEFKNGNGAKYIYKALKSGISGYLTQQATPDEIIRAVRFAHKGKRYLQHELSENLINSYILEDNIVPEDPMGKLSSREKEVLKMVSQGKSSKEIGSILNISESTVKTYRKRFMDKLELKNIPDLVKFSIRNGIISI